ncbi:MAG: hypothetical protein WA715_26540 [Candidatus Acidiferrum sp.]
MKKKPNPLNPLGWFEESKKSAPMALWDDNAEMVARRVLLPKKVKALEERLQERIQALTAENEKLKAANDKLKLSLSQVMKRLDQRHRRAAKLAVRLRNIKDAIKHRPMPQWKFAEIVDKGMRDKNEVLSSIAPLTWQRVCKLPTTLTEILTNPRVNPQLKRLAKTYISKA